MKALYRKYRPRTLGEVVGQEQVTRALENSLKSGKIGHAYLFVGPRGCGKTSVARILAHEVNGFEYNLEDDYVDIIEIDGASNRGIDDVRELREKVMIAPTTGKYKVYIIDEVHMFTKEAFNALLKTLEEPPEHAIFIMATTDVYKVPITITSRAQTYTFRLADNDTMFKHLKLIAEQEKIAITDDALKIIVKRGGGSFRDSLSLLDQISTLSNHEITEQMVIDAMGLPQDEKIDELLLTYLDGDIVKITTLLKELLSSGVKAETLAEEIIGHIIEHPRPELMTLLSKLPDVKAPFVEAKLLVALCNDIHTSPVVSTSRKTQVMRKVVTKTTTTQPARPDTDRTPDTSFKQSTNATDHVLIHEKTDFSWQVFLDRVQSLNDAVYSQLVKTQYELDGDTLNIYPPKKIVKSILSRENNKRVLVEAVDGKIKIIIHEVGDGPNNTKKDEMLSKISDIMGGEVQNDGGGNPF